MEPQAISQPSITDPFMVGEWVAEPMANRLRRGDDVRRLEPKVMEVLACMAARPGETITKEEFMEEVWTGTIVTDDVLARCISELRKALGDRARSPEYVETIRKRGYALIAPVGPVDTRPSGDGAVSPAARQGATGVIDADAITEAAPESDAAEESTALVEARPPIAPSEVRARLRRRHQRARRRAIGIALGVAVLVAATAAVAYRAALQNVRPLAARPVTSSPGEERDPALSPDGRTVAFAWSEDGGSYDLYTQPVDGGAPVLLSRHPADDRSPAWSPDGDRIAFARCVSTGSDAGCSLMTIDAGGGDVAEVADLGRAQVHDLAWSPDGLRLAFAARDGTRGGVHAIHLVELDGSPPMRLTLPPSIYPGDLDPAFSPDGQTLAFVRTTLDGRQDVALVSIEGGEVQRLAREQKGVTGLDWTADGREVVYAASRDGAAGLWRVARGGDPRWVALGADGGQVSAPSTARDGRGIAFSRQLVRSHVAELRRGGTAARPLVRSTREDAHPAVSPDGRWIAFVSQRSGHHEIWTANADGSDPNQLTRFEGPRVATPRWSPDGTQLALSARGESRDSDIFIVDTRGEVRQVTDDSADDVAPSWSRDGRWLYFASNRDGDWQIYRLGLDGDHTPQRVTLYGGVAAAEGPGRTLLVVRHDKGGLWRLAVDADGLPIDRQAVPLPTRLSPADWANWAVEGDQVYALERRADGDVAIIRIDPLNPEREFVASTAGVPEQPGLAVFPGAQRFLLSQSELTDSDIVLVEDFE